MATTDFTITDANIGQTDAREWFPRCAEPNQTARPRWCAALECKPTEVAVRLFRS